MSYSQACKLWGIGLAIPFLVIYSLTSVGFSHACPDHNLAKISRESSCRPLEHILSFSVSLSITPQPAFSLLAALSSVFCPIKSSWGVLNSELNFKYFYICPALSSTLPAPWTSWAIYICDGTLSMDHRSSPAYTQQVALDYCWDLGVAWSSIHMLHWSFRNVLALLAWLQSAGLEE